ncbi:MAG TPA: hypothetical protein DCL07_07140 [Cryomorphaceae bacterium]|nr:hypothetical protein [Cryomorphaceae bacterium]|tara:strand:+ start:630 stop:1289 length:660 start_codon:yes stop_codon:yes gene_type:complete
MRILLPVLLVALTFPALGQRSLQSLNLNVHLGSSNHIGDFATGDINAMLQEARPSGGVEFSFYTGSRWGFGAEMDFGALFADNAHHKGIYTGVELHTTYATSAARITYHLLPYGKYWKRNAMTPYLFGTVGGAFSQSSYMEDIAYPTHITFDAGTNLSATLGGGLGFKTRHSEHLSSTIEYYNTFVPGDRLEGWHTGDDQTWDRITGIRLGLIYSFYTW